MCSRTTPACIFAMAALMLTASLDAFGNNDAKEITAATVEEWADKEFGTALADKRLAGAAIAVVKDGKLLFMRGYGYADYVEKIPMDPANSMVRICSLSKLFTATALMQLLERGQIDSLQDDANRYLKRITLQDFNGRPITLRDLTTHRGGFEDSYFNAATTTVVDTPVDADIAQELIPEQIREPGTLSVYSNANAALLGMIIEDISGSTLRQYFSDNILIPLGMDHSVLNDNPPAPAGRAFSYILFEDGSAEKVELVAKHPLYAPAGGMFSTALDMSRFLIAHLNGGANEHGRILSPEMTRLMHTPAVRNHPALGALGVQFYVEELAGERVVNHGCGLPGFTSYLVLLPERHAGMFVSVVSSSELLAPLEQVRRWMTGRSTTAIHPNRAARFYYNFLKTFVGFPQPEITADLEKNLSLYTGAFKVERRIHKNLYKFLELLEPASFMMNVSLHGDGGLSINGSKPYRAIGLHTFQRGNHPANVVAFEVDEGKATRLYRSTAQVYSRVPAWFDSGLQQSVLIWAMVFSLTGFGTLLSGQRAHGSGRSLALTAGAICLLAVCLFLLVGAGFPHGKNIEHYVYEGGSARLILIAVSGNLLVVAAAAMSWFAGKALLCKGQAMTLSSVIRRIHFIGLAITGLLIVFILVSVRVIGLQLPWF